MSRRGNGPAGSGRSRAKVGVVVGALAALIAAIAGGGSGACSLESWIGGESPSGGKPSSSSSTSSAPTSRSTSGPSPSKRPSGPLPKAESVHLEMGAPTSKAASDDLLLQKPQYALAYSRGKNVASWVSWNLNASHFGDVPRFKGKFLSDASLPEGYYRVRHEDYVGSGYDRGHMVRSEERTRTADDNKATFLLTNVLPQYHDLNAGPWLRLEEYCQELAQKGGRELYIVAGGVFPKRPETIGKDVAVPQECFKIIVVLEKGQGAKDVREDTRVIAVLMPNTTGILDNDWGRYRTTVDDIERRAGYDFLPRVPEAIQAVIEARVDSGPTGH